MPRLTPTSPSVVDLPGEFAHRMLHTRGVRLHAAVAGDPADPLVLLIHGAYGGWFDFRYALAPLASRGYHVAALDQRGFGMSDKPAHRGGNLLRILRGDLGGVIHTLGHANAALVAADTGAVVARALEQAQPQLVRSVLTLPNEPHLPAWLGRLPAPVAAATATHLPGTLDRAWRTAFHATLARAAADSAAKHPEHPAETLATRLAALRIENALPHILATHRLRRYAPANGANHVLHALPYAGDPGAFVRGVEKHLAS